MRTSRGEGEVPVGHMTITCHHPLHDKGTTEDEYKLEIEKLEKRLAEYEDLVDKNVCE